MNALAFLKNSKKPQDWKLDILAAIKHCCQGPRGAWRGASCLPHQIDLITKVWATFACNCQHTFFQLDFYSHASFTHKLMYVCMHTHTHRHILVIQEGGQAWITPTHCQSCSCGNTSFSIVFHVLYLTACSGFQFHLDLIRLVVVCSFDCGGVK